MNYTIDIYCKLYVSDVHNKTANKFLFRSNQKNSPNRDKYQYYIDLDESHSQEIKYLTFQNITLPNFYLL